MPLFSIGLLFFGPSDNNVIHCNPFLVHTHREERERQKQAQQESQQEQQQAAKENVPPPSGTSPLIDFFFFFLFFFFQIGKNSFSPACALLASQIFSDLVTWRTTNIWLFLAFILRSLFSFLYNSGKNLDPHPMAQNVCSFHRTRCDSSGCQTPTRPPSGVETGTRIPQLTPVPPIQS